MENQNFVQGDPLKRTDVYAQMEPLLSPEACKLMEIVAPKVVFGQGNYRTEDGTLEFLSIGIIVDQDDFSRAVDHMAGELNQLAASGLWHSTKNKPHKIDFNITTVSMRETALTCYVLVPSGQMAHIKTFVKSAIVGDGDIFRLR